MAIDGFSINGTAIVSVASPGNSLATLGYTDQGVDIRIEHHTNAIITDVMGPLVPHDFQEMGLTATITVNLIAMDRTILAQILDFNDSTNATTVPGKLGTPGLPLGVNGFRFRVGIASNFDSPWLFSNCILRPSFGTRLATKANPFKVEFFAWPFASFTVTAAKDTVVWTRILA